MQITDSNFDGVLSREETMVVGFGAPWCGNCRSFLPVLQSTTKELGVPLYELVVDDNPRSVAEYDVHPVPVRYDVLGVPTVIVFHGGEEIGRLHGALPARNLKQKLQEILP